jgi:hypothetical protein
VANKRQHTRPGVGDVGGGGEAGVQVCEVRGHVSLDELDGEVGFRAEVVEERALRAVGLGDHLVDGGSAVTLVGHQPLGDFQDPLAGLVPVSWHISVVPD